MVDEKDEGLQSIILEKARTEKGSGYPDRFPVTSDKVDWGVAWMEYTPPYYVADLVLANDRTKSPKGWADPESFESYDGLVKEKPRVTYENGGNVLLDENGIPLNPKGRMGIKSRGLLGNWGPNNAADPIVTRIDKDGYMRMIAIKRSDANGRGVPDERALPGGMIEPGERATVALKRELGEETSAILDFDNAQIVYQGYVDDPRNTDNAWMETEAYHLHIDNNSIDVNPSDDADEAGWIIVDDNFLKNMYASHANMVKNTIDLWQKRTGKKVLSDGKVV